MADNTSLMPHDWNVNYQTYSNQEIINVRMTACFRDDQREFQSLNDFNVPGNIPYGEFETIIQNSANLAVCKFLPVPNDELPFVLMLSELSTENEVAMMDVRNSPMIEFFFICPTTMVSSNNILLRLKSKSGIDWNETDLMGIAICQTETDEFELDTAEAQKQSEVG